MRDQHDRESPFVRRFDLRTDRRTFVRLLGGTAAAVLVQPILPRAARARVPGAIERFDPPARIRDLAKDPAAQAALDEAWNINANGWTEQAILGNPWTGTNQANQSYYFNPLHTDLRGGLQAMVTWPAFPNRIGFYYPALGAREQWEMADTGTVGGRTMPGIPQDAECATFEGVPITPDTPTIPYPPYGPRGWLDEYCEFAKRVEVVDGRPRITEIHFTCENPEYWYTLWSVAPERVVELYREVLGTGSVRLEDLVLRRGGRPVIDPSTGRPAYDPLNKWNRGTEVAADGGGAMHLTSTPNTIQTELQLAGGATIQRSQGDVNSSELICCGKYGQIFRNSDPHIGQITNELVGLGYRVSLANPIGLYIQMPAFESWSLPDDPAIPSDAHPSECWHVVRGSERLAGFPDDMSFILHAKVAIPKRWRDAGATCTVSDLGINGHPIEYGSQVMQTFNVALFPLGVKAPKPAAQACVGTRSPELAAPLQIMYDSLFEAYYESVYTVPDRETSDGSPVQMSLASNTVIIAPRVRRGETVELALVGSAFAARDGKLPAVAFLPPGGTGAADPEIRATALELRQVNYAVPGNSTPGPQQLLRLRVEVGPEARLDGRDLRVTNPGQQPGPPGRWFLWVLPAA